MRFAAFAITLLATSTAWAVDYRWTLGFGQGTSEAIIRNAREASVNIYCPSGDPEQPAGMFVHSDRVRPRAKETIEVQIVVDGANHPFYLEESQFKASGRANANSLYRLVDALANSKGKTFKVEFPKFQMAETFSLLDAKKVLKSAKDYLQGCL